MSNKIKNIYQLLSNPSLIWQRHDGQPCIFAMKENVCYTLCHYNTDEKEIVKIFAENIYTDEIVIDTYIPSVNNLFEFKASEFFQHFKVLYILKYNEALVLI